MLNEYQVKEILEIALDREVDNFDMKANFYTDYGLDSMGAIALFVEVQRRTRVRVREIDAPHLQTGSSLVEYCQSMI